jgi:hypothetical protein
MHRSEGPRYEPAALAGPTNLPAIRGFETVLLLVGAAPELPIIMFGDNPNLLQQMNLVINSCKPMIGPKCYCINTANPTAC